MGSLRSTCEAGGSRGGLALARPFCLPLFPPAAPWCASSPSPSTTLAGGFSPGGLPIMVRFRYEIEPLAPEGALAGGARQLAVLPHLSAGGWRRVRAELSPQGRRRPRCAYQNLPGVEACEGGELLPADMS